MKAKVKRQQIVEMFGAINALASVKGTCRFAYSIAKNKKLLSDEVALMREGLKPAPELIKFDEERIELCKKYAEKDDKGNPKQLNGAFLGLENHLEFEAKIKELQEKYKEQIDKQKKQVESFNELLKEEIEFEFWEIKMSDIPDNVTGETLQPLLSIIAGETNA